MRNAKRGRQHRTDGVRRSWRLLFGCMRGWVARLVARRGNAARYAAASSPRREMSMRRPGLSCARAVAGAKVKAVERMLVVLRMLDVLSYRSTPGGSRRTVSSTSATGSTPASRCSRPVARSCERSSYRAKGGWAQRRVSSSRPIRSSGISTSPAVGRSGSYGAATCSSATRLTASAATTSGSTRRATSTRMAAGVPMASRDHYGTCSRASSNRPVAGEHRPLC